MSDVERIFGAQNLTYIKERQCQNSTSYLINKIIFQAELQIKISDQNLEIEKLNSEVGSLRKEVSDLSTKIQEEREKNRNIEDRMAFLSRPDSSKRN
jgi:predicted  nucleic acid-binding Zn-ribbon protein